jgi:hypothetical protein
VLWCRAERRMGTWNLVVHIYYMAWYSEWLPYKFCLVLQEALSAVVGLTNRHENLQPLCFLHNLYLALSLAWS